jgi:hypothetical protein
MLAEYSGKFKKKVTLSHVYNEVTSEPTNTRYTTIVRKTLKVFFAIDAGKCSGPPPPEDTLLQNGDCTAKGVLDPDGSGPKHFPASITKKSLRVFLTIVVYRVIVGSLVISF